MAKPDPQLLDPARYPARYELATRFQDVDPNQHINNVATAALFEDVRVRFDWGIGLREALHGARLRAMVVSVGIEYLGEAYYPDPIIAYAGGLSVGRTSWSVGAILTQDARAYAFMRATVACVDGGTAAPLPDAFRAAIGASMIRVDEPA